MNDEAIRTIWRKHGGVFYGPRVEHANIKESAFYDFARELFNAGRAYGRGDTVGKNDSIITPDGKTELVLLDTPAPAGLGGGE